MIALLVPTRGRPEKFRTMVQSVCDTTTEQVVIYVLLQSAEDVKSYDVEKIVCPSNVRLDTYVVDIDPTTVHLWNKLAGIAFHDEKTKNQLFMLCADDVFFATKGWDVKLVDLYTKLNRKIHVFSLLDNRSVDGTPHPIVTREYMAAMNYFLPPIFLHWYCDTWTVEMAKFANVFTHIKHHLLIHDKIKSKDEIDETYKRLRGRGYNRRDRYVDETCQHLLEAEKHRLRDKVNL